LAFDFPPGVYAADIVDGMDILHRTRTHRIGRIVYGGLSAHGSKKCRAAVEALADDAGLRRSELAIDRGNWAWLRSVVSGADGVMGDLIIVVRPVGHVAMVLGALVMPGEDDAEIVAVMEAAADSAHRVRERGRGRPSRDLTELLSKMGTFRTRVDASGHRVSGG
jgi:hypothetical protein